MPQINRQANGLLDFLLVQSGGRNPDNLLESLRGVIDLSPYYEPDRLRVNFNAFSLNPGQQSTVHTVPEGEYWMVLTLGFIVTSDANEQNAQFLHSHGNISDAGGGAAAPWVGPNEYNQPTTQAGAGSRSQAGTKNFERPRILTPDQFITILNCNSDSVPAVGTSWCTYVLLER
jgi:hypothetical protein